MSVSLDPRSTRAVLLCAAALCTGGRPGLARADDVPPPGERIELGAVDLQSLLDLPVDAPSRHPELASRAPATVFVVTAADVRAQGYRTLPELLAHVPGLFAYPGDFPQLGVRGVGVLNDLTTRILVLLDGHPLNNSMGLDLAHGLPVPLSAVERVEVIKGPAGSVYGPTAFLAVVNVVTSATTGRAEAWAGAEAAQRELRTGEAAGAWRGGLAGAAALVAGRGRWTRGTDQRYPELGATARHADFGHDQGGYLRLGWRDVDARFGCAGLRRGLPLELGDTRRHVLKGLSCLADASDRLAVTDALTLTPRLALDLVELAATRGLPDGAGGETSYLVGGHDRWLTAELRAELRLGAGRLDSGATFQAHDVTYRTEADAVPALDTRSRQRYQQLNAWVQGELRATQALALHGGANLTSHSRFGERLTPRAAAVWQPTGADTVKLIWSSGLRPPTVLEAYVADAIALTPNPDLRPETVSTVELAADHRFAEAASVTASAHWNRFRDTITYVAFQAPAAPPGATAPHRQQAQNGRGLTTVGLDLAAKVRLGRWLSGQGGVSLQRPAGSAPPGFPRLTAGVALSSRALWQPLLLGVRATALSERRRAARPGGGDEDAVPWAFLLGGQAALDVPGAPGLTVELSVVNALDARAAGPAPAQDFPVTELDGPPRTFRADARWAF